MADRPDTTPAAAELYDALAPLNAPDAPRGWPLLRLCQALAAAYLDRVWSYAADREDDAPGWQILFDPDLCPVEALPYLGQFVGVVVEPSWSEAETRQAIREPLGFRRGTPAALRLAVERTLTGSRSVYIDERYTGSAYRLRVRTLASETPDAGVTLAAVLSQKPVGTVLTYAAIVGWSWDDVVEEYDSWTELLGAHPTWNDLVTTVP